MMAKVSGPFDLIFQDGDKQLYAPLLDRLVALLRPGGLLVTDNVLWDGEVVPGFAAHADAESPRTRARLPSTTSGSTAHPQLHDRDRAAARRRGDLGEDDREHMRSRSGTGDREDG